MTIARIFLTSVFVFSLNACAANKQTGTKSVVIASGKAESPHKTSPKTASWGFVLSPINPGTEDPDGTLRIWHSKIGSNSYSTKKTCMEAAKKGLEYLAGEAWNFKAVCTSPPRAFMPIATATIDVSETELEE